MIMVVDAVAEEHHRPRRRVLCRFEDHRPFAYARGGDYYRCVDHNLWACQTDGQLLSVRSGEPIAYQRGNPPSIRLYLLQSGTSFPRQSSPLP